MDKDFSFKKVDWYAVGIILEDLSERVYHDQVNEKPPIVGDIINNLTTSTQKERWGAKELEDIKINGDEKDNYEITKDRGTTLLKRANSRPPIKKWFDWPNRLMSKEMFNEMFNVDQEVENLQKAADKYTTPTS